MQTRAAPLLAALLLPACAPTEAEDCTIAAAVSDAAGDGAEDCGRVEIGGDSTAVDACVVAAFEGGTAFGAIYELQGIDSQVTSAIASDGTTVWFLSRDSDPSGGGNVGAVVNRFECAAPAVEMGEGGHDVLTCTDPGPSCAVCGGSDDGEECG